ncbi:4Fe-4S dicluster domain-containing protein [Desulfitibacter alkalitolerans]|uniref:4Fe-4S dicluster domain-containing protein n=1 Tax=Desulfitibacter alkalitolerans TaxID=264641 RepID=UPI0004853C10|nr:4Fe-4S binding protein [Desulfitibacter alkalitolerans]
MQIDASKCIGCGQCRPFCTMGVIHFTRGGKGAKVHCFINEDECVDCGICYRANVCKVDALHQAIHDWPRSIRGTFSNPLAEHKETRVPGRGTEEIKTNDITNRYKRGYAGMAAEMGRPGTGARLRDTEKVFKALARVGVDFETHNPLTGLLMNKKTGEMNPEVLDEKVLSAIIEMIVPLEKVLLVLETMEQVAQEIDTVFSIDLVARVDEDLSIPTQKIMEQNHKWYSINGKTNVGLGSLKVKGAMSR